MSDHNIEFPTNYISCVISKQVVSQISQFSAYKNLDRKKPMLKMAKELRTSICLFRNDLRVHDNETLLWAHKNSDHVVPLYCFDPDHFKGTWHFNLPKTGVHRAKFTLQSVHNLRQNLQKMNSNLVVHHSHPLQGTFLYLKLVQVLIF